MSSKPRILIVEDEAAIRSGLIDVFTYHGFKVDSAADGSDGWHKAQRGPYDLVLLDVMLPGMDGFEICRRLRETDREQAIILLTARSTDEDVIHGLSLGADDYVAKPFSIAELVLRVNAVLRRARVLPGGATQLELGADIRVDPGTLQGRRGDELLSFTRREMDVLQYLHAHSERAVSREELLHKVWGYANALALETRTVDIHIAKLRRKLEPDATTPRVLLTVRGAGYRLPPP
ncbi:MAG: response regulator transcription factor [Gammaproteobacteria bacterium]|mgnify:CR=1 FL=1|nr:response regulator transcription factor [Gammaproteobacteria bacterium]